MPKDLFFELEILSRKKGYLLSSKDELLDFFKEQIKIENKIVDSLNSSLVEIKNPAVRGVLKGISLDSAKHADMYGAAVKLLTEISPALTQEHLDRQKSLVEEHIRLEAELIEKISKDNGNGATAPAHERAG